MNDDRFRHQDPDRDHSQDDLSTSMGGYDEADIQQDPGAPEQEYYGQYDYPSDMGGGGRPEDEFAGPESDLPEDDTERGR
ncbi:hypothetical protein D0T12_00805 [Actinomadura spongiicola]|uniref:Uncharacterized protein n=1 Tax=Actinomadura spongiicola TaxID=2303421 RepID=A0A372GN98_9ACTN|nr:hypothetical protein [Actinomadura spongiicola]RFS86856.1 hypothetical protein D0T12_00805 [Actinomadura spongiicola]